MPALQFARRVRDALVLFWLVVTFTFILVRLAPGDPATLLIPPDAPRADATRLRHELGLDASPVVQYARWIGSVLRGNLGESFATREPVSKVLRTAAPLSLALGLASLAITFVVGVPIGLLQGARRGSKTDRLLTVLSTTVYAAPSFWLALASVALFTYAASTLGLPPWLRLPAFGVHTPGASLTGWSAARDMVRHAILPVIILAAIGAGGIARYARTGTADVFHEDFVRTARAKGASETRVLMKHVLANMLPSLVVLLALALPGLLAGSIFVEAVFAWPGMGRAMLDAINARDYPVVMGSAMAYAAAVIAANLAADLALPWLDPRRRAE